MYLSPVALASSDLLEELCYKPEAPIKRSKLWGPGKELTMSENPNIDTPLTSDYGAALLQRCCNDVRQTAELVYDSLQKFKIHSVERLQHQFKAWKNFTVDEVAALLSPVAREQVKNLCEFGCGALCTPGRAVSGTGNLFHIVV